MSRHTDIQLRSYQRETAARILREWESHASIMVQMPTGTGKTHLLASLVNEELRLNEELRTKNEERRVWIVAHRRELVEQIEETVARYGIRKEDGRIKVMSIQWLSRHWEDVKDERPSLIVIDEAHHALAETYKELWTRYPDAKKLGMTATPCRLNRKGFTDLFEVLITSDSIADFIRQGWLSVFDYVSIRPDSEDQRLVDSLSKRGADGDYQVKEMNAVLNRRPTIERLYKSVRQYAAGKKGIVYAISIEHARNIASYYINKGISAAAIDSRTPAKERKRLVEDFRQGRIQVLVNVDVFSEGFDCPDVEFVQLARPTLSLAKYLQQVGRGLRKTEGKESCMLIDNVGLYRMFGLPTAERDWQAMFEGRLTGKGSNSTVSIENQHSARRETADGISLQENLLEQVIAHEHLSEYLQTKASAWVKPPKSGTLRAFKDRASGLYGLKCGNRIRVLPRYTEVFDTEDGLAAVQLAELCIGIVDETGEVQIKLAGYRKAKFLKDRILSVTDISGKESYIDLRNGQLYSRKPKVLHFGQVQMLEVDGVGYSRTKRLYRKRLDGGYQNAFNYGFYLRFYDFLSPPRCRQLNEEDARWGHDSICLLADDYETYYHCCGLLPDGSIVVEDLQGTYYHVEKDKEKQYIACESPKTTEEDFNRVIPRLKAEAEKRIRIREKTEQRKKNAKRQKNLLK